MFKINHVPKSLSLFKAVHLITYVFLFLFLRTTKAVMFSFETIL